MRMIIEYISPYRWGSRFSIASGDGPALDGLSLVYEVSATPVVHSNSSGSALYLDQSMSLVEKHIREGHPTIDELVADQKLAFPRDPHDLGNFWPEEESIDDFLV